MYSGFITAKRTVPAVGVHQRFDTAAYRMTVPYFADGTFPILRQILHFEGMNGPDGIKAKAPSSKQPSHLYDPASGGGDIPHQIDQHYSALVDTLRKRDLVRAGFEAAWMAHYLCDGLTPAHHFPLDVHLAEHAADAARKPAKRHKYSMIVPGSTRLETMRRSWALWGGKGLLTTHLNFELGVAAALVGHRIRVKLDHAKLAEARTLGLIPFFEQEAREIAQLEMYETFYRRGWNAEMARLVKNRLAPQTAQIIAIAWLLAYLEAGLDSVLIEQARTEQI